MVTVCALADVGFALPSKDGIKASQAQAGTEDEKYDTKRTMFGTLELDSEYLYRVPSRVRNVT